MDEYQVVTAHVKGLSVNIDNEDVELFEGQWPVPHGVALHAFLVSGSRAVIVDPWDAGGYGPEEVEADLQVLGLGWKDVAVAFTKAPADDLKDRLKSFHCGEFWGVPTPGARHDLGLGVFLEEREGFWFVAPDGVALTGDTFAGLGWIEDEWWAEDLNENQSRWFDDEALRWFAGRPLVPDTLPSGTLVVAPSHGCLWGRRPEAALDRAQKFAQWGKGPALDEVTVVWPEGTHTDQAVEALVGGILDTGAGVNLFRVPADHPTTLAAGALRASFVVVAEGLDAAFLRGLDKALWRPDPATPAAVLRAEVAERFHSIRQS